MIKGGYKIIDFGGKPLREGVGMQYDGLYNDIESTNKAILISGFYVDGVEYDDAFSTVKVDGSNYRISAYGYTITISDLDIVTVQKTPKEVSGVKIIDLNTTTTSGSPIVNEELAHQIEEAISNGEYIGIKVNYGGEPTIFYPVSINYDYGYMYSWSNSAKGYVSIESNEDTITITTL